MRSFTPSAEEKTPSFIQQCRESWADKVGASSAGARVPLHISLSPPFLSRDFHPSSALYIFIQGTVFTSLICGRPLNTRSQMNVGIYWIESELYLTRAVDHDIRFSSLPFPCLFPKVFEEIVNAM